MDQLTALAAFAPLLVDAGKGLIGRFIVGDKFKPASIAEWLQMRDSDARLFEAVNNAGQGAASYPWVAAVIQLQRPCIAALALGTWAFQELTMPGGATATCANFAATIGFYLFGDRTLFKAKQTLQEKTK